MSWMLLRVGQMTIWIAKIEHIARINGTGSTAVNTCKHSIPVILNKTHRRLVQQNFATIVTCQMQIYIVGVRLTIACIRLASSVPIHCLIVPRRVINLAKIIYLRIVRACVELVAVGVRLVLGYGVAYKRWINRRRFIV